MFLTASACWIVDGTSLGNAVCAETLNRYAGHCCCVLALCGVSLNTSCRQHRPYSRCIMSIAMVVQRRGGPQLNTRSCLMRGRASGRRKIDLPDWTVRSNGTVTHEFQVTRLKSLGRTTRGCLDRYRWVRCCFLRFSSVTLPYFLVKRSTRPSVSMSFWRPVKNG